MHKLFLLTSFILIPCYSSESIILKQIESQTLIQDVTLEQNLNRVYLDAFQSVYTTDWTPELEEKVVSIFKSYIEQFKQHNTMLLVAAHKDSEIVGWALFNKENDNAVLEILCISPQSWRQGIGRKLVFSICDYFPEVSHIALLTRKINAISPHFYEGIGFKKTDFMLPEYRNENMQGFEWTKS